MKKRNKYLQNPSNNTIKPLNKQTNVSGNLFAKTTQITKTSSLEQVTNFMVDALKRKRQLWRKELTDWQMARYARFAEEPKTYLLQELYEDIILDAHLTAVTENRTLNSTNKNYVFSMDGVKNDQLTELIKSKTWFENILQWAHQSIYYEYSLIWVKDFEKGNIKEVSLVPRGLVIPEKSVLLYDVHQNKGLDFTTLKDVLLFAKLSDGLGLFEKAAPYTILKRHSFGSWDEFEELYGIPIRIAKVASQSEQVKNEVSGWLQEMGSAAYGVFPMGTEVEIKENSKTDAFNVFLQKIQVVNSELSKLVKHETMTTDNGSSRSQSEVHQDTFNNVVASDHKKILAFLNDTLVPSMRLLGYKIPDNAKITIDQKRNPTEQIKVDGVLLNSGYILTQNYIEETYGVEVESIPTNSPPSNEGQGVAEGRGSSTKVSKEQRVLEKKP